jgi:hypothetical protein
MEYSKPLLIQLHLFQVSDDPDQNMKNEKLCSQLNTYFKSHMEFRNTDESLVCSDKTWDSFFKPTLLRPKTSTTSESSIYE